MFSSVASRLFPRCFSATAPTTHPLAATLAQIIYSRLGPCAKAAAIKTLKEHNVLSTTTLLSPLLGAPTQIPPTKASQPFLNALNGAISRRIAQQPLENGVSLQLSAEEPSNLLQEVARILNIVIASTDVPPKYTVVVQKTSKTFVVTETFSGVVLKRTEFPVPPETEN